MRLSTTLLQLGAGWLQVFALGCGGDSVTEPFGRRLTIVAGGGVQDTILTRLATPLVVQYRVALGVPRSGVTVRLEAVAPGATAERILLALADSGVPSRLVVTDTTDTLGRVVARVAFGISAGFGWVRATAPTFGLSDSTSYVVLPGSLAKVTLAPVDTALYVAATMQFRAKTLDRWGNERSDLVSWSATTGIVEPNAAGQVRGVAIGRDLVRASAGGFGDSVGVSVVPHGVIAAMFLPIVYGEPPYFLVFNTDGSDLRRIDVHADCGHGLHWTSTGDRLLFGRNPGPGICFTQRLYTTTLAGSVGRLRPDSTPLAGEFWPRMTADGGWVYFTGRPDHQNGEIWRVRPDGTAAERVGPAAESYDLDQEPSPSPDGAEVVYQSERAPDWTGTLHIINTTTRAVRDLGVPGTLPSWSPRGDLIAFLRGGQYHVVAVDGSSERNLVDTLYAAGMAGSPSWSPDGRWMVVVVADPTGYAPLYGKLALVEVESEMALSLGWTAQLTYPSWRPVDPPQAASREP